jgi:peptidoglycan/xylan/chitin deacetylase (PgdA/CDA1 family)
LAGELPILAYHRIFDDWQAKSFEFDPELVSATSEDFEWQMRFVKERFSPVTFAVLDAHLRHGEPLPKRPIIVTFDDGFEDNFTHAFPILRRLGIPATIFLATGYIGGAAPFWYDWLFYLWRRSSMEGQMFSFAGRDFATSRTQQPEYAEFVDLISTAKMLDDRTLRAELARLERSYPMACPANGFEASRPLNWQQVTTMSEHGIEFGSHMVSHPVMSMMTEADLVRELADSKNAIERHVGRQIRVIAYPVGESYTFNESVLRRVADAGYRYGVTYEAGTNKLRCFDALCLKRVRVERYTTREEFVAGLAFPGW